MHLNLLTNCGYGYIKGLIIARHQKADSESFTELQTVC